MYCGKWRIFHAVTLNMIGQCPLSKTCPSYFNILQYVQVSSGLNFFLSIRVHRHTERYTHQDLPTDRHRHTHTDRYEYSIVAVDKPQL